MYLVTGTRPDLTFAISFLTQFSSTPNKQHVVAVKCCLPYIKGTRHLTLLFSYGSEIFIPGFSDSDYGNYINSRRSVSGYLFKLRNSTISWRSQTQQSVFISTTEAEYVALSKAAKHFLWLKTTLKYLRFPETPMALFYNNHSAIDRAENYRISELSKHIDIHYHQV
jgi:hypothetical protein